MIIADFERFLMAKNAEGKCSIVFIVIKSLNELLMRGVQLPLEVAKHMVEGKQGW